MENKDIILFILIICVLYLLYCNERKEQFRETSSNTNQKITESIKNLGIIANKLQKDGNFTFPADLIVTGKLNLLPEGTVVMWTRIDIPDGWVECNGENGTPDLRGRFVIGTGQAKDSYGYTTLKYDDVSSTQSTEYQINDTGGWEDSFLTVDNIAPHKHETATDPMPNNPFGHSDKYRLKRNFGSSYQYARAWNLTNDKIWRPGGNKGEKGSEVPKQLPFTNMPPYYALIYIMKVY